MDIRPLLREKLNHENGADAQRLVPWEVLNAPFEGSWCVIPAGGATGAHSHHEYEIFIAVTGEAVLDSENERRPFRAGDIVHFQPGVEHRAINESSSDFEMYCIWWDTELSEKFVSKHAEQV
jgi:quercetin dioxygenase-like cupin family protein